MVPRFFVDDLEDIASNVHLRFLRWLKRHELLKNEEQYDFSKESPELSALEASSQGSLGLGNLVKVRIKPRNRRQDEDRDGLKRRSVNGRVGQSHGYSLYAGNAISAEDKDGRERLLRYCLRAPLSLERLSIGPDGNTGGYSMYCSRAILNECNWKSWKCELGEQEAKFTLAFWGTVLASRPSGVSWKVFRGKVLRSSLCGEASPKVGS